MTQERDVSTDEFQVEDSLEELIKYILSLEIVRNKTI